MSERLQPVRPALYTGRDSVWERAKVAHPTIAAFALGNRQPYERTLEALRRTFEDAGLRFIDPVEGVIGEGVVFKWGVTPPARQASEGAGARGEGEAGFKAAWDDAEEDADIDALLGEPPAPDPGMADYWREQPELWEKLSEAGRETLSRTMFGDGRAADEGYFRGQAAL